MFCIQLVVWDDSLAVVMMCLEDSRRASPAPGPEARGVEEEPPMSELLRRSPTERRTLGSSFTVVDLMLYHLFDITTTQEASLAVKACKYVHVRLVVHKKAEGGN